ncbi:MAG: hypothetical protein HC771_19095 [Synechococcales cyanobacterium CRU_2_2]|nr:hypothetical protein [Synechococcales cyanobacterium CRU_2_2]
MNPDEDLRQQLEIWLAQRLSDPEALLESVQSLLAPGVQDADTAPESHLLIYVRDDDGESKPVLALFVPNADRYDSRTGAVSDRVQAPGIEPFNEQVTLAVLPKLVRACINEVLPKSNQRNLVVHLILPFTWLHADCDRWSSTEQSQLPAVLSLDLPQIPIGDDFSVVFRISERLNQAIPELCRQKWNSKWESLDKLKPHERCAAFVAGDQYVGDQLVGELNKPCHVGLKRSTVCPEVGHRSLFGLLIGTGIPAALLVRQDQFDQSLVASDAIDAILNCNIARLPEAVRQCRADAMGQPKDKHIGHHLAFLWENPQIVPPSTEPRSAMSFGMPKAS